MAVLTTEAATTTAAKKNKAAEEQQEWREVRTYNTKKREGWDEASRWNSSCNNYEVNWTKNCVSISGSFRA